MLKSHQLFNEIIFNKKFASKVQTIFTKQPGETNVKKTNFLLMLTAVISIAPSLSHAASQYVRAGATGSGNGSDWTNAYAALPTTLIRGDVYYIADGNYSSYHFNTPNNGTSITTIKKAIESDHGSNTGWQSSYGDGQAIFGPWSVSTDYFVFDGQIRNSDWHLGKISQYGIKVKNTGTALRLDNSGSNFGDNLTFNNIDFEAGGRDTGQGDDVIYSNGWTGSGTGPQNVTFSRCAMHDSDRTIFLMRQWRNLIVEYSYIARQNSTPEQHGEIVSDDGSDNIIWRYNIIEDPEGTGVWAILNGAGGDMGDANAWEIYGNVIFHSSSYTGSLRDGISGVLQCVNDSSNQNSCSNWKVYNNTIYNIKGLWSGFFIQAGAGNEIYNNIWYGSVRTNNSGPISFGWNWYYNTLSDGDTSNTKQSCTSDCTIFIDSANKNFRLARATNIGNPLPSPYNMDIDGILRGSDGSWDRGAYEFGGQKVSLQAPTGLVIVK